MAADPTSTLADTAGWDTVFAIRVPDVNGAIVKARSTPPGFSGQLTSPTETVTVDGTFSDWQLTKDGDGQDLLMALPMPVVHYNDGTGLQIFDAAVATIEVRLTLLPRPGPQTDGAWMELRLRSSPDQPVLGGGTPGTKPVSVTGMQFTGKVQPDPNTFAGAFVQEVLEEWLNNPANLSSFGHVFAAVNVNARAAVGGLQWLMPTDLSYALVNRGSLETSTFALLCMTEGRDSKGLAHQVSPHAVPDGQRAALLISPGRFLSKLILPSVASIFSGPVTPAPGKTWPEDYFSVDEGDATIINTADIQIDKFRIEGNDYVASLAAKNLNIRLENTYIEMKLTDFHHQLDLKVFKLPAIPVGWLDLYHTISIRSAARLTDQLFDLLPTGTPSQETVAQPTATAEKIENILAIASIVASVVFIGAGVVRGIGWLATPAVKAAGAAAEIGTTATVDAAETANASATLAAEGAQGMLTTIRTGVVDAGTFLGDWRVMSRSFAIAGMAGTPALVDSLLDAIGDREWVSVPVFQIFVTHLLSPVQWPAQQSQFVATSVAFNGSFQIVGNPGFAD